MSLVRNTNWRNQAARRTYGGTHHPEVSTSRVIVTLPDNEAAQIAVGQSVYGLAASLAISETGEPAEAMLETTLPEVPRG